MVLARRQPPMIRQNGFTLVEMLFVVGIVGILASFAAPVFTQVRYRAIQSEAPDFIKKIIEAEVAFWERPRLDALGAQLPPCTLEVSAGNFSGIKSTWLPTPPLSQSNLNMITIGVSSTAQVYFGYSGFGVQAGGLGHCATPTSASSKPAPGVFFWATAIADLDGDGVASIFASMEMSTADAAVAASATPTPCFNANEKFYLRELSMNSTGSLSAGNLQVATQPATICP